MSEGEAHIGAENRAEQGLILLNFLEQARPTASFPRGLETNPSHVFDKTVWYALRPVMKALASGKETNWWHWHNLPDDTKLEGLILPGDPDAFSTADRNGLLKVAKNIRMSLGGWTQGYIIGPEDPRTTEEGWRYAFERLGAEDKTRQYCAVISRSPIAVLAGPDDFKVAGIRKDSMEEVPLKQVGPFPNRAKLPIF